MLKDYRIAPARGGKPARAVIFLHGVGDRGDGGLLGIGEAWRTALPDCEFLCPDASFPFDMAPPESGGRQWFSLQTFAPEAILAGAIKGAPYLDAYIDHVLATRGLTPDKLAVVGFSQGTIMALYALPRRREPVAGIVGYAGLLTGGALLPREKQAAPPVLLVHGKQDEVIPFAAMAAAAAELAAAASPVATLACPSAGHTIDETGMRAGLRFIQSHWGG